MLAGKRGRFLQIEDDLLVVIVRHNYNCNHLEPCRSSLILRPSSANVRILLPIPHT